MKFLLAIATEYKSKFKEVARVHSKEQGNKVASYLPKKLLNTHSPIVGCILQVPMFTGLLTVIITHLHTVVTKIHVICILAYDYT